MQPLWLGLDVGTQGTKGVLVDLAEDRILARASKSYGLIAGLVPGAAEQEPMTWWDALRTVTQALVKALGAAGFRVEDVGGIGVSGQQHGFVPMDERGEVIRPAKLWCDTQTASEARELSRRFGRPVPAGFSASKILWLKRHEPRNFARLAGFALPHDWINLRLCGRLATEAGDASGTGLFDPFKRAFRRADAAAIDPKVAAALPEIVPPDQPLGSLCERAARELGLAPGLLVAPGGGDNMMSAIGSGATKPGLAVCSLGTSCTVFCVADAPVVDPSGCIAPFCDSTGAWLPLLCVMNGTGVLEELRRAFGCDHDALTSAAGAVPPGADGALFLPFLQGERTPDLPDASGTLLGLRAGSFAPGVLYRAALEGIAANLAWGIRRMRALGLSIERIRVVGGGSKNSLWCEILAASFGVPLEHLVEAQSAALGAALQAAWIGARREDPAADLGALCERVVRSAGTPVEPDSDLSCVYADLGTRFQAALERVYDVPEA